MEEIETNQPGVGEGAFIVPRRNMTITTNLPQKFTIKPLGKIFPPKERSTTWAQKRRKTSKISSPIPVAGNFR
jgi:hypothetical protein